MRDGGGATVSTFKTSPFDEHGNYDSDAEATSAILTKLYEQVARLVTGAPQMAKRLLDELDLLDPDADNPFE